jgi:serine/threonine protein phosphatase PrpC
MDTRGHSPAGAGASGQEPGGRVFAWHWRYSVGQDVGQRPAQEDSWAVLLGEQVLWAMVADGLGGHPLGQAASAVAVQAAMGAVARCGGLGSQVGRVAHVLREAFRAAHAAVQALDREVAALLPPATTLLVAACLDPFVWIGHSGDSRALLVRGDGQVKHLTVDMTPAGERVEQGLQPWEHQNTAADRHLLLAVVGVDPSRVRLHRVLWQPGDHLVLATDGLNPLPEDAWPELLKAPSPAALAVERAQPQDNATVIVVAHPRLWEA